MRKPQTSLLRRWLTISSEAVEALKEEIWKRAREKADKILNDARNEAERILRNAKAEAENFVKNKLEPEKLIMRRRIIGKAMMDGRRLLILTRNDLINEVFSKAVEKLKRFRESEEYEKFLVKCLKEAVEAMNPSDGDEFIVYVDKRDLELLKKKVGEIFKHNLKFKFKEGSFMGGVVVMDSKGKRIFYNTIESRLESLRPLLREKIASMLFREVEVDGEDR